MAPECEVDLQNAGAVCDLFERAAEVNRATPGRSGSMIDLPARGRLLVSGDLHDNRVHFEAVMRIADLEAGDQRHVVLQELIHGQRMINGMDFSYRLLARAAAAKLARPAQVHVLLSNHELAQIRGEGILKDGVSVVGAYNQGLAYVFGEDASRVAKASEAYVRSLPLAVRCGNGIMVSHSLPPPRASETFDKGVLMRELTAADYDRPHGSAHMMVWGRGAKQAWLDELAEAWGVKLFVIGHEKAEMGAEDREDTLIVINSDHSHGSVLPIDLARRYARDDLLEEALPLNAL